MSTPVLNKGKPAITTIIIPHSSCFIHTFILHQFIRDSIGTAVIGTIIQVKKWNNLKIYDAIYNVTERKVRKAWVCEVKSLDEQHIDGHNRAGHRYWDVEPGADHSRCQNIKSHQLILIIPSGIELFSDCLTQSCVCQYDVCKTVYHTAYNLYILPI